MRWLCLILFFSLPTLLYSQEKEVSVSEKGATTNANKADVTRIIDNQSKIVNDSIRKLDRLNEVQDSLNSLKGIVDAKKIYSEKQWRRFYDSLKNIPGANIPAIGSLPLHEVSEQEMINAVNKKFYSSKRDSIIGSSSQFSDPTNLAKNELENSVSIPKTGIDPNDYKKLDPTQLKLSEDELNNIMPLSVSTIKTKYLKGLDSIRRINLLRQRINLSEKKISKDEIITDLAPKPRFWDKTYFEGVVGFTPGDFKILQASPTLGYHFMDYISLGVGPNISAREEAKKTVVTVGMKTFLKAEILKRQAYFQLEDIMDSYGARASNNEGKKKFYEQHNLFVGGGVLLSIHAPVTINFSILYNVTKSKVVSHEYSPMVFRIGLSSLKLKKNK